MASTWPQTITITLLLVVLLASTPSNASTSRGYYDNNDNDNDNGGYMPSYTNNNDNGGYMPSYTNYDDHESYMESYNTNIPVQEYKPYYTPPTKPAYKDGHSEHRSYTGSTSDKAEFLQVHNDARSAVGLSPYTWDDRLASFAQSWANQRLNDCRLVHSNGPYGENIFWGSGGYSAAFATQSWVNERKYYDLNSNSCAGGMDCGHYTQIIWKKSTRLGCARVTCNDGGVFVTCNYDPPGNYIGTRPY